MFVEFKIKLIMVSNNHKLPAPPRTRPYLLQVRRPRRRPLATRPHHLRPHHPTTLSDLLVSEDWENSRAFGTKELLLCSFLKV